jgi:hypothetical protein
MVDSMDKYKGKVIRKIGNVLSHYVISDHVIVDKYEFGNSILNYSPGTKFDLIVSISTFEHLGYDKLTGMVTKALLLNHRRS